MATKNKRYLSWPEGAAIESLEVDPDGRGGYTLTLTANPNLPAGDLAGLLLYFYEGQYKTAYPDARNGQHLFVVPEVKNPEEIINMLAEKGYTQGAASGSSQAVASKIQPAKDPIKWGAKSNATAWGARWLNGHLQKDPLRVAGVVPTLLSMGFVSIYGGKGAINTPKLVRQAGGLLGCLAVLTVPERKKHPDEQPVTLIDGIASVPSGMKEAVLHPLDAPKQLLSFIQESPMRFNAMISLLPDNIYYLLDSFQQNRGVGGEWNAGNAEKMQHLTKEIRASQANPEQFAKMDRRAFSCSLKKQKGLHNQLVKSRNLRAQYDLQKTAIGKYAIPHLTATTVLCYFVSSILWGMGSKNRSKEELKPEKYHQLYALTARHLLPLPEDQRELVLRNMVDFYANHDDVKEGFIPTETIENEIRSRVEEMQNSPWIMPSHPIEKTQEKSRGVG